jgi:hypothetical protein
MDVVLVPAVLSWLKLERRVLNVEVIAHALL